MPTVAAVVAAPNLKLCQEYLSAFPQTAVSAVRSSVANFGLVNGSPVWKWNKGPAVFLRRISHDSNAAIGHSLSPVLGRWIPTLA